MIKIAKIIGAFIRGTIKALPLGNAIIEGVHNVKGGVVKEVTTEGGESVKGTVNEPHSWISIAVQVAVACCLIYAFVTKQITIEGLVGFLQGI